MVDPINFAGQVTDTAALAFDDLDWPAAAAGGDVSVAVTVASGTGAAYNAAAANTTSPGNASGTGTAYDATAALAVSPGVASGTGTAYDATAEGLTGVAAGNASGTGTGYDATVSLAVSPGNASGIGVAYDATLQPPEATFVSVVPGGGRGPGARDEEEPAWADDDEILLLV